MSDYKSTYSDRWENLTLANNFLFCKIMESNPDLCKQLLELLLHIKIDHLEKPAAERTLQASISSKSVRFDVYTKDDNRIFDIEMQTVNKSNLPKRARYYQSIIDVSNLNAGMNYTELKDTYIIFICLNDLFGRGLPVYSFENNCKEDRTVNLDDGTYKIFFNSSACDKIESAEERAFFNFLKGKSADTNFTRRLSEKLLLAKKNLEWRNQFMTFREQYWEELEEAKAEARVEARAEGLAEGRAEGLAEGRAEGEKAGLEQGIRQAALMMIKDNLSDEQIAKYTGLSEKEIAELRKKQ